MSARVVHVSWRRVVWVELPQEGTKGIVRRRRQKSTFTSVVSTVAILAVKPIHLPLTTEARQQCYPTDQSRLATQRRPPKPDVPIRYPVRQGGAICKWIAPFSSKSPLRLPVNREEQWRHFYVNGSRDLFSFRGFQFKIRIIFLIKAEKRSLSVSVSFCNDASMSKFACKCLYETISRSTSIALKILGSFLSNGRCR